MQWQAMTGRKWPVHFEAHRAAQAGSGLHGLNAFASAMM